MTVDGMKRCPSCGEVKPVADFPKNRARRDGRGGHCRACEAVRSAAYRAAYPDRVRARKAAYCEAHRDQIRTHRAAWREANRDRIRAQQPKWKRKHRYGLTDAEYQAMLERQGHRCFVCGQLETARDRFGAVRRLAVDHDHHTGRVRALLCHACNTAIGLAGNDADRLMNLAAYLRGFAAEGVTESATRGDTEAADATA